MVDLVTVVNPKGETVKIENDQLHGALSSGYSLPATPGAAPPVPMVNQLADAIVPGHPELIKAFNKNGEPTIIERDQADDAQQKGFQLFTKQNTESHNAMVAELEAQKNDPQNDKRNNVGIHGVLEFAGPGLDPTTARHEADDIRTPDNKYKLLQPMPDGTYHPVNVDANIAFDFITQNPGVKFQDPKAQAYIDSKLHQHVGLSTEEKENSFEGFKQTMKGGAEGVPLGLGGPAIDSGRRHSMMNPNMNNRFVLDDVVEKRIEQLYSKELAAGNLTTGVLTAFGGGEIGAIGELALGAKAARGAEALAGAGTARGVLAGEVARAATIATPQILANYAINQDPQKAVESYGIVGGLGMLFGGGRLAGKALQGIESLAPKVEGGAEKLSGTEGLLAKLDPEVDKALRSSFLEAGIKEESTAAKVQETLQNLSEGKNFRSVIGKIDPFLEKEMSASSIENMITTMGQKAIQADEKVAPAVAQLSKNLEKLADNNGNISLNNLQKFIAGTGEHISWGPKGDSTINELRKSVQQEAMTQFVGIADVAAAKAGAKVASEWSSAKAVSSIAKQLHLSINEGGSTQAFSPAFKLIKTFLGHKAGAILAGAAHGLGPIGSMAGAAIGHKITDLLDHSAANPENPSKIINWLYNKAQSPAAPSYLILDAIHAVGQHIEKVPDFIKGLATKGAVGGVNNFATKDSPIKQILGTSANGLSKDQQFMKLSNQISMMAGNQQIKEHHLNSITAPFAKDHPGLAEQMKQDYDNKIQYLHQILPKNPNPPKPFVKEDNWKPSKTDLDNFETQLKVAQNPFVLLDKLKEGKITPKEVATASMLNPQILNHIRDQINTQAYSGKVDLTYQQKLNMSVLMGTSMHASLDNVQALQSVYGPSAASTQPVPPGASGGKPGKGGSHLKADKMPATKETMAQRLMK